MSDDFFFFLSFSSDLEGKAESFFKSSLDYKPSYLSSLPCTIMFPWNSVFNHITEKHATKKASLKIGTELPNQNQQH